MLKQAQRDVAVSSPLGEDALVFRRMVAVEQVSQLFSFEVELLTARPKVDFYAVLGQDMTVRVATDSGERHFNGFVASFGHAGSQGRYGLYKATLRPWLWFLTRNRDCRIFQDMTVPDIVKALLREHGFTDIVDRLSGSYEPWEYCVQYQESDFAFLSRLLEHEGIYYYFTHRNGAHALVLGDGVGAHDHLKPSHRLRFNPEQGQRGKLGGVEAWTVSREVTGGAYTLDDFDFERPKAQLRTTLSAPRPHALSGMEVFEYPGDMAYMKAGSRSSIGQATVRHRMEELKSRHEHIEAATTVRELACGQLFSLTHHPNAEQNREYLVLSAVTEVVSDEFEANSGSGGEPYACHFTVLSSQEQYRPPRLTPLPVMRGPQTAIVSGKPGEEIWTDKYGRIKVRFHWDRNGKADETSSCWIRVAQSWAGKRWGAQFLPRIGQEVIVDFLDGDPNRPVVTGSLYNGDAMPAFDLPENATQSGLRTNTVKGAGANELRFEDKSGKEQIFIHAQRNQDNRVKNDLLEWIGNERHLVVVKDQLEKVKADKHQTVDGDHNEKIGGTASLTVGEELHERVGQNAALQAGMDIHLKAGMNLVLEAGVMVTLKVAGSFITIGPSGVTISGPMVLINSGGSAGSGSGANPDAPKPPKEAAGATPGSATTIDEKPKYTTPVQPLSSHPAARQLKEAYKDAAPFCAQREAAPKATSADGNGEGA
ncbi:type VI secretion system tip protein VgrG [Azospirillum sp. A1-3]|uniref:type VI secretion system Vgr family protein n=1 Tax=Azospirillum sp. A1-3 TaxID=185874 RepID=UPI0020772883|nr:type VI secretion system tip protein TssI/VgrG [Azospirillum sp. A1-3]MCM8738872.1 type VI secretion system tip protein VgrG [Azospirillum sp. A1-3]